MSENMNLCQGKIKLPKRLITQGVEDSCHNIATYYCEDCGKEFCSKHSSRNKHNCDDSIKGCHGIWTETLKKVDGE